MGVLVPCTATASGATWEVNLNQLACALETAGLSHFTGVVADLCVETDCDEDVFIPGCGDCFGPYYDTPST